MGAEWLQNELSFSSSALVDLKFGLDGEAQKMRKIFLYFLANRKLAGFMGDPEV